MQYREIYHLPIICDDIKNSGSYRKIPNRNHQLKTLFVFSEQSSVFHLFYCRSYLTSLNLHLQNTLFRKKCLKKNKSGTNGLVAFSLHISKISFPQEFHFNSISITHTIFCFHIQTLYIFYVCFYVLFFSLFFLKIKIISINVHIFMISKQNYI